MASTEEYIEDVQAHRREKDEFFAEHPHSPIPVADREDFGGLSYFPPNPELRYELPLKEHDPKETIVVETTTEGEREYLRWGAFEFEIDGEPVTLHAFKAEPDEERLWVPFRDATNGDETYGAGRYLDLETETHRTEDGWILDFNQAYNPYCAYSDQYECPLIPLVNWLEVPVRAGEKDYHV
ncbi:MAG: DUF1684 domain-containing protein, partial [Halobacteriales archaeon]|nr:DUF1684 domain-containing protein [Halobacteriales archaeon]